MLRFVAAAVIGSMTCATAAFARPQTQPASPVITRLPPVTFGAPPPAQPGLRAQSIQVGRALQQTAGRMRAAETRKPAPPKTICGMTVIEQSPELDARAILPPDRSAGSAVRRIDPQACTAGTAR